MEQEPNLHEVILKEDIPVCIDGKQVQVPILITADGYFGVGESQEVIAISGRMVGDIAQLRHIFIAEKLRGQGVGVTLLTGLEERLRARGVKRFFLLFFKPATVDFFLQMGYQIVPQNVLTREELLSLGLESVHFDSKITNIEEFQAQRKEKPGSLEKILLMKRL